MANYLAPGVYVEEIPSAQQPIAGVGTNTAAFIGIIPDKIQYPVLNKDYIPPMPEGSDPNKLEKERLNKQKTEKEGDINRLNGELKKTGIKADDKKEIGEKITRLKGEIRELDDDIKKLEPSSSAGNQANNKPYILETFNVQVDPCITKLCTNFTEYTKYFGPFSADVSNPQQHGTHRALTHAVYGFFKNGGTRCFVTRMRGEDEIDKALLMIESIDEVSLVAAPGMDGRGNWDKLVAHCDLTKDRFAILDCTAETIGSDGDLDLQLLNFKSTKHNLPKPSKNAAFYFPPIEVVDPAKQLQDKDPARNVDPKYRGRLFVPPSGHIAGIYARTDEERGVHKAPANTGIAGALNVKYFISRPKQDLLNPQGVNCIRNINGNIVVYGARTIGGDMNGEWKYVNVRRVMLYLEESIDEGTQWVVFEPNDMALWGKIRRNVSAFLTIVWRSGALIGATPEEAFYVKCDAEINPPEVRDLGQVVIEVGVSIVRPAEFVIFRISQSSGGFSA